VKLTELEPRFLRRVEEEGSIYHRDVVSIGEAEGVMFLCPKCFQANGERIATHFVICWSPKVPPEAVPGPGRWELVGTGFADLTLRAGSSSVQLLGGCNWHGFITNGDVSTVG
jgi:hypothetical protein